MYILCEHLIKCRLMVLRITYQEQIIARYNSLGHEISSYSFPVYSLRNHNSGYCRQHILLKCYIQFQNILLLLK